MKHAILGFLFLQLFALGAAARDADGVDPARRRFLVQTTVEAYDRIGMRDPRWNEAAHAALQGYSALVSMTNTAMKKTKDEIQSNALRAIAQGCTDPLIQYLGIRYDTSRYGKEAVRKNLAIAEALHSSRYPAIRRCAPLIWSVSTVSDIEELKSEAKRMEGLAAADFAEALDDASLPVSEVAVGLDTLLNRTTISNEVGWDLYHRLEVPLEKHWMGTPAGLLAKGRAYINYAWMARGIGLSGTVTDEGWKLMSNRLTIASKALEGAWKLDPKNPEICRQMMTVELGQGEGRSRLEMWFDRGMKLDPFSYDICWSKLYYLYPRWYGSDEEMLRFGRLCLTNTNWSGRVPLILVEAHREIARSLASPQLRAEYWWKPEVWQEVQAAYESYLTKHQDDTNIRHDYAKYAMKGGKPLVFVEQVRQFKWTNALYFGKAGEFEEILKDALEFEKQAKEHKR